MISKVLALCIDEVEMNTPGRRPDLQISGILGTHWEGFVFHGNFVNAFQPETSIATYRDSVDGTIRSGHHEKGIRL